MFKDKHLPLMSTFAIGDVVSLPQGHQAILRWIGRIPGRTPTEYAGVEVLGPEATRLGKHNGSYQGQQYFQTETPGTGLFVSYTQLVSVNIKTPRLGPPASPSPMTADDSGTSIGLGSPIVRSLSPIREVGNEMGSREFGGRDLSSVSPRALYKPSPARPMNENVNTQRNFFREALRATNEKVTQLGADFEAKLEEVRKSYEEKLMKARRSSNLLQGPGESEVEEQRLALAAMQNKLINERTEKQEEIDNLKRELQHMRKLAGSAEDLEALVGDLAKYDEELTKLRSQVDEMDQLKEEVGKLRSQNAQLELSARNTSAASSPALGSSSSQPDQSGEISRLERMLEQKLVHESELEALVEQLQSEVQAFKTASQPLTPDPDNVEEEEEIEHNDTPAAIPQKVPVPPKLNNAYDDSSMMVDLAAGRSDWCSLCEREGHSAVDCPYE